MRPSRKSANIFHVQVGRGRKGAYQTRYSFDSVSRAEFWYECINIGNGYKKRLITRTGKVLHRYAS